MLPKEIGKVVDKHTLLDELDNQKPFQLDSLVKACDMLGVIIECVFERDLGNNSDEMIGAYNSYISKLQNSEWPAIRKISNEILIEYPKLQADRA